VPDQLHPLCQATTSFGDYYWSGSVESAQFLDKILHQKVPDRGFYYQGIESHVL
jgi:hypothetical protein